MARSFESLRERMSPGARARVDGRVRASLLELNLQDLRRQVSGLTQAELARLMDVTQSAISQLEGRDDVLISNLAQYVRALGGRLELIARFPKAEVRILQFGANTKKPGRKR